MSEQRRRVLRNRRNLLAIPFFVMMGLCGVFGAVVTGRPGGIALGLGLTVLSALGGWRGARNSVVIHEQGIIVHNLFRSHRLSWEEIETFTHPVPNLLYPVAVDLVSGRRIGLTGLDENAVLSVRRELQREAGHAEQLLAALAEARERRSIAAVHAGA